MKNDSSILSYKEKEKEKPDSKFYSCINTVQHLLVELCKKITHLQFSDCSVLFKNKLVAGVLNFLRVEYPEELALMNNFLKILNKMPEIFQKYYNMEIDAVVDIINSLSQQKLFRIHIEMQGQCQRNISHNNNNSVTNNIFLEFMIKHVECVRDMLELMKLNLELFSKLSDIYKLVSECFTNTNCSFDEEVFREVTEDFEKLIDISYHYLSDYADSEYLQNTFFPLMTQIADDINTMKSLLKAYRSLLYLDHINTISNLITTKRNIDYLKQKYQNMFELKIYIFFIQFYLDNTHKCTILFKTYFDNKKINLLQNFNDQKLKQSLPSDIHIKEEVFQFKNNFYVERYMKKCFEENLDIFYFILFFEKKKFLDLVENLDPRECQVKNYYITSNSMFIESDDELGVLSIFHTNSNDYKAILGEVGSNYKNLYTVSTVDNINTNISNINSGSLVGNTVGSNIGNMSNISSNTKGNLTNFNSFSYPGVNFVTALPYIKQKVGAKEVLLTHKISNFMFISVKIKEKSGNDLNLINELCRDFRLKFADMHIFKTIFSNTGANLNVSGLSLSNINCNK